jgi:hypothetical protein
MKKAVLALALAALAAGCGSDDRTRLALSAKPASSSGAALTVATGFDVTRVRIVVDKVKLERFTAAAPGSVTVDEVWGRPFLVDLGFPAPTVDPAVPPIPVVEFDAPAGTFDELKLRIHKINPGEASFFFPQDFADLSLGTGAGNNASIRIDGTTGPVGQEVPWAFLAFFEEEIGFDGPFVVEDEELGNVTLSVDPAAWFAGPGGAFLDPRDEANRLTIEQNIKASLRAFDDDDRNGFDDRSVR